MLQCEQLGQHYSKWKKSVIKDHMLYDSIYSKCPAYVNLETNRAAVGVERMEEIGVRQKVSSREDKNVLKLDEVMRVQPCEYAETY